MELLEGMQQFENCGNIEYFKVVPPNIFLKLKLTILMMLLYARKFLFFCYDFDTGYMRVFLCTLIPMILAVI